MRSAIGCPTAAKTGTTSELVDAWLDGYNPRYSTVVWMGYPNRRVSMTDVHGEPQQGGYLPAEIWHAYMSAVVERQLRALPLRRRIDLLPALLRQVRLHRALQPNRAPRSESGTSTETGAGGAEKHKPQVPRQADDAEAHHEEAARRAGRAGGSGRRAARARPGEGGRRTGRRRQPERRRPQVHEQTPQAGPGGGTSAPHG